MDIRAVSYEFGKAFIRDWICNQLPTDSSILDVGSGSGTYYYLLHMKYPNMDAVEIYEPNIKTYKLDKKYKHVYNYNITELNYNDYDLIIFGDIIEHLTIDDAQKVLKYALSHSKHIIVAVPYCNKANICENKYEKHIQDDLTPEIMKERYPFLKLLTGNNVYGYYIKNDE